MNKGMFCGGPFGVAGSAENGPIIPLTVVELFWFH